MTKEKAMEIAQQYAKKHHPNYDRIWYAGEKSKWHFVWMKNTSLPRYTGLGVAIKISPSGDVYYIDSGMETLQISRDARRLNSGD